MCLTIDYQSTPVKIKCGIHKNVVYKEQKTRFYLDHSVYYFKKGMRKVILSGFP